MREKERATERGMGERSRPVAIIQDGITIMISQETRQGSFSGTT